MSRRTRGRRAKTKGASHTDDQPPGREDGSGGDSGAHNFQAEAGLGSLWHRLHDVYPPGVECAG